MKHTFILLLGAMLSLQGQAQDKQMQFQNTIKVEAGDSMRTSSRKRPMSCLRPTSWRHCKTNSSPSSISDRTVLPGWNGEAEGRPEVFDLKELDTDQWCEAMKAAGMKMVILTVKHHDGFVLWQSVTQNTASCPPVSATAKATS